MKAYKTILLFICVVCLATNVLGCTTSKNSDASEAVSDVSFDWTTETWKRQSQFAEPRIMEVDKYEFLTASDEDNIQQQADMLHSIDDRRNIYDNLEAVGVSESDFLSSDIYYDGVGYTYVLLPLGVGIYVTDDNGEIVFKQEYTPMDKIEVKPPIADESGELIFLKKLSVKESEILLFDKETNDFRVMIHIIDENISQLLACCKNKLFYRSKDSIIEWNIQTGERKQIFSLVQMGISERESISSFLKLSMCITETGQIQLKYMGSQEKYIATLTDEPVQKPELTLASLQNVSNDMMKPIVAQMNRRLDKYNITFKNVSNEEVQDYRTRTLADMVAGKGPDMLWVKETDMWILQEKGLVSDVREYLPEEALKELRSNMLSICHNDEGLWGLPVDIWIETILVNNNVWEQDSWTLSDIMQLLEEKEYEGIFTFLGSEMSEIMLLRALVLDGLEKSEFVDWDNGISNFDSENFVKALEICKKYGIMKGYGEDDLKVMTKEGSYMGELIINSDFQGYFRDIKQQEMDFHAVGLPTENMSGNFLCCKGVLVVNNNSNNKEAIKVFLECLISEDIQRAIGRESISLIELPEAAVEADEESVQYYNEYLNFINNSVPYYSSEGIRQIVEEEASAYFYGDTLAKRAAEIINNRVQLYLDERK